MGIGQTPYYVRQQCNQGNQQLSDYAWRGILKKKQQHKTVPLSESHVKNMNNGWSQIWEKKFIAVVLDPDRAITESGLIKQATDTTNLTKRLKAFYAPKNHI